MIEEQYVSFETAKLAKEKGFNELCNSDYCKGLINYPHADNEYTNSQISEDGRISRPTQSLLARWLREKFNQYVFVVVVGGDVYNSRGKAVEHSQWYDFVISDLYDDTYINPNDTKEYGTFEEAMEAGLQEALKRISDM